MGLLSNTSNTSVKNLYSQQQQNIDAVVQDTNAGITDAGNQANTSVSTGTLIDSLGSFFGTVGSVWNSTNNVKVAKLKVTSLQGELDALKLTNNGKEIDLKAKQLEVEQTKLEEATKLAGYSFALKGVVVVSILAIILTYIKNPIKLFNRN